MNIEQYRDFCISKPGTTEEFPFGEQTLVFKVMGKMYSLTDIDGFESINLKCDPEKAAELRETHSGVKPGYHMNKKHWNTIMADGTVSDEDIFEWTNDSYALVVDGLPKNLKQELKLI